MSEIEEKQLKLGYPGDRREGHEHDLLRRQGGRGIQLRLEGRAGQVPEPTALGGDAGCTSCWAVASAWTPACSRRDSDVARRAPLGHVLLNPAGGAALESGRRAGELGQSMQQSLRGRRRAGAAVDGLLASSTRRSSRCSRRPSGRITVIVKWKEGSNPIASSTSPSTSPTPRARAPRQHGRLRRLRDGGGGSAPHGRLERARRRGCPPRVAIEGPIGSRAPAA